MFEEFHNLTKDGALRCSVCGAEIKMSEAKSNKYLGNGWPKCCGYTMTLITGNEKHTEL
jgi:peptide methionine sulfoxide reductase MsrB